jgi:hypothetical protein
VTVLSDEKRSYIDGMEKDFKDNLPILVLWSASCDAELARLAVGTLKGSKEPWFIR